MPLDLLEPGTVAPAIEVNDQDGKAVSLKAFKGHKVILYFYPKDDTPGCTKEACNLRDNYDDLLNRGFKVLGVSIDDEKSHRKFIEKFDLPFPLLADTQKKVVNNYKVWGEKNMYGRKFMGIHRVTYIIDEEGKISHVIKKVKTDNHTQQILDLIGE